MSETRHLKSKSSTRKSVPGSRFPVPAQKGVEIRPNNWPRGAGYSHGVSAEGRLIFVAGQIGWEPVSQKLVAGGIIAQTRQALANIVAVVRAGGAEPEHIVRLTWFITDRDAYLGAREGIGAAYRDVMSRHFPSMSVVVVSGLLEPGAEVEIEATAVIPRTTRTPRNTRAANSTGAKRRPS